MEAKNFLFSQTNMAQLSRERIFPTYIKELGLIRIDKELRKRDQLSNARSEQLTREKEMLKARVIMHSPLFKMFMTAFEERKHEVISDLFELIEAHYMPRVAED